MENLILTSDQCPGDMVMLSAALRDLHAAHPGKYCTDVRTPHPDIWRNNPLVTPLTEGREIPMQYNLVHRSNQSPYHFIHGYRLHLEEQLGISIPAGAFRGDIRLTAEEKSTRPAGVPAAYWVIASGGKRDYTAKWWDAERWQAVVDYWTARGVQFVQVGGKGDVHPPLRGVTNLVGKTTLRQLIHVIAHADGVLCAVTSLMHLAAALPMEGGRFRPCVVVAGGREPSPWEAYPGHAFLDTMGQLPCCASGGCWKSRVVPGLGGDLDKSLCVRPIEIRPKVHIPECLHVITAARVIESMSRYMSMAAPKTAACSTCGAAESADPRVFGPRRWREFHHRAGRAADTSPMDADKERAWLAQFMASLPCVECREESAKLMSATPPVFTSREAYRRWGIAFHNAVNDRLGKPQVPVAEAERMIEAGFPLGLAGLHARNMVCVKCEFYGKTGGPLMCHRDGRALKAKIEHGQCDKWPGHVEPFVRDTTAADVPEARFGNKVGVVIGTYGAVPYIHLQLESLRRFHPGTPCLVVDDGSPQRDELAALCAKYGAEFVCNPVRMNHARGDMQAFIEGHEWARSRGIGLLVKFSRRWIPIAPWMDETVALWEKSGAPTLCNTCSANGFGFRSECVAMDVAAWDAANACDGLRARIRATEQQPGDMDVGASGMLVEHIVHVAAAAAKNHSGWGSALNFEPWPFMGKSRSPAPAWILWHERSPTARYLYQLALWGIAGYTEESLLDPKGNIHRDT